MRFFISKSKKYICDTTSGMNAIFVHKLYNFPRLFSLKKSQISKRDFFCYRIYGKLEKDTKEKKASKIRAIAIPLRIIELYLKKHQTITTFF